MSPATYPLRTGFDVTACRVPDLLRALDAALAFGQPVHICTLNPEIVMLSRSDGAYRNAVQDADIRTIDGVGISLAVRLRYGARTPRLTGVMLTQALIAWARDTGRPVTIVGASEASRRAAEARMRREGLRVVPGCSPSVDRDGVADRAPTLPENGVVMVSLGAPKQEMWIRRCIQAGAPPNVFIGNGGAVDYYAGTTRLPPRWIRRVGLEWLVRLLAQPRLRLMRQLTTLPGFVWNELAMARFRPTFPATWRGVVSPFRTELFAPATRHVALTERRAA